MFIASDTVPTSDAFGVAPDCRTRMARSDAATMSSRVTVKEAVPEDAMSVQRNPRAARVDVGFVVGRIAHEWNHSGLRRWHSRWHSSTTRHVGKPIRRGRSKGSGFGQHYAAIGVDADTLRRSRRIVN